MSSKNLQNIDSLINAIGNGLTPGQTTDLLRMVSEDLDKVFSQVNTGPLPEIDGLVPLGSLPHGIAFLDEENQFTQNQELTGKTEPTLNIRWLNGTVKTRLMQPLDGDSLYSTNLYYNGSWNSDSGDGSGLYLSTSEITFLQFISGAISIPLAIDSAKTIKIGVIASTTGCGAGDVVIKNSNHLRSVNNAGNNTYSMMRLDSNDLIGLGSDATSAGPGHVAIPQVTSANLPAAGAAKDGIIVIDKTNHRLCFYESGNRYFCAGTAF